MRQIYNFRNVSQFKDAVFGTDVPYLYTYACSLACEVRDAPCAAYTEWVESESSARTHSSTEESAYNTLACRRNLSCCSFPHGRYFLIYTVAPKILIVFYQWNSVDQSRHRTWRKRQTSLYICTLSTKENVWPTGGDRGISLKVKRSLNSFTI